MEKQINTSWRMFFLACGAICFLPLGYLYITWDDADARPSAIILMLALVSILGFFMRGWMRVRAAHRVDPIYATELDKVRALLRGPRKLRVIWFSTTILFVILSALMTGLLGTMQ